jgi:hypothetical protein
MQAQGFVRNLRTLLIGACPLVLAACGGNDTISVGGGGSSGGSSAFHGTFFGYSGNSTLIFPTTPARTDLVFGVAASDGRGFFADTQTPDSQAIFNLSTSSSTGGSSVGGSFNAYAAAGSALGDDTTIALGGGLSGTLSSTTSGITQAALTLSYPSGYSNSASIILDNPALTPTAVQTGSYVATAGAGNGAAAIASAALSSNTGDVYTVSFTSATSFNLSSASGCSFVGSTAVADGTYNIYLLSGVTGTCPGTSTIALSGLASFLPASGHSPIGGALAQNTLVLELDDSQSNNGTSRYALALVATRQ